MLRARFEKSGNAVWISHLDLMRLFQRAFKRAGLPLTHTQGYNPRPSVSIALPLSVGVQSHCELLDFELEGEHPGVEEICRLLNENLVEGIRVACVYEKGSKIGDIAYLRCMVSLKYDAGIPDAAEEKLKAFFAQEEILVEKKNKNGISEQNIASMIRSLQVTRENDHTLVLDAVVCCQNPTLNPMQLTAAIHKYLPELAPDHSEYVRVEIFDRNESIFV